MDKKAQREVAIAFNDRINAQDIDGLAALMTDDHAFIDSAGNSFGGKEKAIETWKGFFAAFPDYRNVFEQFVTKNDTVAIAGHSICSHKELDGSALWAAKVRDDKVAEWRVYDDTRSNRERLGL